jgi:hypothetical protein
VRLLKLLSTRSGLTWGTIRKYGQSPLLERDDDGRPLYLHSARCPHFCDFACNGIKGNLIAEDVDTDEGEFDD